MVVISSHREVAKALSVARLATHRLLVSVDAVFVLELLATTLAEKHMTIALPNFVLVRRCQRLKSLVTDSTGGIYLSIVLCPLTLISYSNNMNSPTNQSLAAAGPGASR